MSKSSAATPRRSCLYLPASNPRALAKAATLACDVVILDLEDAVAAEAKDHARSAAVAALTSERFLADETWVRINGLQTDWGEADLAALASCPLDGIVLPKVNSADDIHSLHELTADSGAESAPLLWAMIETPLGVLNLPAISACGANTRLEGLIFGSNDLALELRLLENDRRSSLSTHLDALVLAARAFGLTPIDGVFNDFKDEAGFQLEAIDGARRGFSGKTLIHPAQIALCNTAYSPTDRAIEHARAVCQAFAAPENAGKGVLSVNGVMTERLHLLEAERVLATSEKIQQERG